MRTVNCDNNLEMWYKENSYESVFSFTRLGRFLKSEEITYVTESPIYYKFASVNSGPY